MSSRKKKSVRNVAGNDEIEGVIRRGLAESTGRMPSETIAAPGRHFEDSNPYNHTGRTAMGPPKPAAPTRPAAVYKGFGNPYDTARELPAKQKRS